MLAFQLKKGQRFDSNLSRAYGLPASFHASLSRSLSSLEKAKIIKIKRDVSKQIVICLNVKSIRDAELKYLKRAK
jgi:hypothetical protein